MEDLRPKEKVQAFFTSTVTVYSKGFTNFYEDVKTLSKYTMTKVKSIPVTGPHRQQQQHPLASSDLVLDINPGAGSEVLSHYKYHWGKIHQEMIESSKKVNEMYRDLQGTYQTVNNAHQIVNLAKEELSQLPNVLTTLEDTNAKVESIEELLRQVEDGISEYIKVTEELEYERKKHSARIQLQKFKEERENELRKWEGVVNKEKQATLERQEQLEQAAQRERQDALKNMFDQQMAEYLEKGEVEKPILSEEAAKSRTMSELSVENMEIEDVAGSEQLKEFLSDVEHNTDESLQKQDEEKEEKNDKETIEEDP